jgi:ketosteroid isomerase-like protein
VRPVAVEGADTTAFRRRAEHVLEAFNRGDFEAAWGGLPEDFEFHSVPDWPDAQVARGPREVIDYFENDLRGTFPDWRGRIESVDEVGPGVYLNHLVMEGAGRAGGVPTTTSLFQVWEMDGERPVRVREFLRREEAMAAGGDAAESRSRNR